MMEERKKPDSKIRALLTNTGNGYELSLPVEAENRWAKLIKAGQFDEVRAGLSMMFREEQIREINPRSIVDIFRNDTPSLNTIRIYQGEEKSRAAIELCLMAVNDFFGAKSGLSDGQLQMLSNLILGEYGNLTLADLKYCIRQGLLGRYEEKIFGKATPDVIMRWLNIHVANRLEKAAEVSEGQHRARMKQQQEDFHNGVFENMEASERWKLIREMCEKKWAVSRQEKTWRKYYRSLDEYCAATGKDAAGLTEGWEKEYQERCANDPLVSLEDFLNLKKRELLFVVNNK